MYLNGQIYREPATASGDINGSRVANGHATTDRDGMATVEVGAVGGAAAAAR